MSDSVVPASPPKSSVFPVVLRHCKEVALETFECVFAVEEGSFIFEPGQYIWLVLPQLAEDPRGDRRAFSISSAGGTVTEFSILVHSRPSSFMQALIHLQPGSRLTAMGPHGQSFTINQQTGSRLVLVANGTGIAPFLSILHSFRQLPHQPQMAVVLTSPSAEKIVYADVLQQLCQENGIQLITHIGHINMETLQQIPDPQSCVFFVCGSQHMVNATTSFLQQLGVPSEQMRFEQFYPIRDTTIAQQFAAQDSIQVSSVDPFRLLVENTSSHLIVTDENGLILYANEAAQRITGFKLSEMVGNSPRLWSSGWMGPRFYHELWLTIKQRKTPFVGQITNRRKNGETYHALTRITPIIRDGGVIGFVASEEDISERVEMEEVLVQQKNQLQYAMRQDEALLGSIGEGLVSTDAQGKVILINPMFERILGWKLEDIVGRRLNEVVSMEDAAGNLLSFDNCPVGVVLHTKQRYAAKLCHLHAKDGRKIPVAVVVTPVIMDEALMGTVSVFRDITQELAVDEMKTEFISLASHQLRAPVSTISWYIEALLSGDLGALTEEQRQFLIEVSHGAKRMASLVNALLNVARLESGTFVINPVPVDVAEIISNTTKDMQPKAQEKSIFVQMRGTPLPTILLDPELLQVVFQNLLTNAIKYSPVGGEVSVAYQPVANGAQLSPTDTADQDGVLIQVSDHGMGIPQAQQAKIFDKLFRADNAQASEVEGTGLGLYISKKIIEEAQGKIWFESTENVGTTFSLFLPLSGMKKREGTKKIAGTLQAS